MVVSGRLGQKAQFIDLAVDFNTLQIIELWSMAMKLMSKLIFSCFILYLELGKVNNVCLLATPDLSLINKDISCQISKG